MSSIARYNADGELWAFKNVPEFEDNHDVPEWYFNELTNPYSDFSKNIRMGDWVVRSPKGKVYLTIAEDAVLQS